MPVFKYKAALKNGKHKKGIVDAASRAQAARKLREDGLYPIDITPMDGPRGAAQRASLGRFAARLVRRVPRDALAATVRQLAILLKATIPLDKALGAVIKDDRKQTELQRIISEVRERIREGGDLASAFAQYPHVFNSTFVTMVQAGEKSGSLEIVMERLADHMDQQLALRRKVQAALAYPILMLVVGLCVVAFLLAFVVPKVTAIFFDMNRALPLPTQILIAVSDIVRKGWSVLLLGGVLLGYGGWRLARTAAGKKRLDALLLRTPVLGDLIRNLAVSRFSKTLGMLLKNGVSIVSSLEIVKSVSGNTAMQQVVRQLQNDVQEGKPLADPMEASNIFEPTTVQMIAAGEQSGRLDEMLLFVAEDCENKVNNRLQVLTSLMEPIMILLLGGLVGFVVMAIMLPIFEMSNLVGG